LYKQQSPDELEADYHLTEKRKETERSIAEINESIKLMEERIKSIYQAFNSMKLFASQTPFI
jgi:hypothetical protein